MTLNQEEAKRFCELCIADEENFADTDKSGINIYNEKRLHRILKRTLCSREEYLEVKVGRYIADILEGKDIIEIQCGSFYPLVPKLRYYLENTDFNITVVHPLIADKTIIRADRETGEILRSRRSNKKENETAVLPDLYYLREFIGEPRLRIRLMMIRADEIRYSERVRNRKEGAYDSDLRPRELLGSGEIKDARDILQLLPEELMARESFGAAEFSAATKYKRRKLSLVLYLLCDTGLLKREKEGKKYIYFPQV